MSRSKDFSKGAGLPIFEVLGGDDHPLGKRSIWTHPDGRVEGVSQADGMTSTFEYEGDEAVEAVEAMRKVFRDDAAGVVPMLRDRVEGGPSSRFDGSPPQRWN